LFLSTYCKRAAHTQAQAQAAEDAKLYQNTIETIAIMESVILDFDQYHTSKVLPKKALLFHQE